MAHLLADQRFVLRQLEDDRTQVRVMIVQQRSLPALTSADEFLEDKTKFVPFQKSFSIGKPGGRHSYFINLEKRGPMKVTTDTGIN